MTSTHDFQTLNFTFDESSVDLTWSRKLSSIWSNQAEYPKGIAQFHNTCYPLLQFENLHTQRVSQPVWIKMTSVRGRDQPICRGQASEAPTGLPSSNGDHKDPLGSNKSGPFEAPAGSEAPTGPPETPPGPSQAPPLPVPKDPGTNRYSQQDLDRITQTFLQNSKGGSRDKLKAKTPDVYHGRSHMERYHFCQ